MVGPHGGPQTCRIRNRQREDRRVRELALGAAAARLSIVGLSRLRALLDLTDGTAGFGLSGWGAYACETNASHEHRVPVWFAAAVWPTWAYSRSSVNCGRTVTQPTTALNAKATRYTSRILRMHGQRKGAANTVRIGLRQAKRSSRRGECQTEHRHVQ
jgi:hypothetical protein